MHLLGEDLYVAFQIVQIRVGSRGLFFIVKGPLRTIQSVADKGDLPAVGRPRWNVDRSLPAKESCDNPDLSARGRHQSKDHILVWGMTLDGLVIRKKDDPLSVGRGVRKPVAVLVV